MLNVLSGAKIMEKNVFTKLLFEWKLKAIDVKIKKKKILFISGYTIWNVVLQTYVIQFIYSYLNKDVWFISNNISMKMSQFILMSC